MLAQPGDELIGAELVLLPLLVDPGMHGAATGLVSRLIQRLHELMAQTPRGGAQQFAARPRHLIQAERRIGLAALLPTAAAERLVPGPPPCPAARSGRGTGIDRPDSSISRLLAVSASSAIGSRK